MLEAQSKAAPNPGTMGLSSLCSRIQSLQEFHWVLGTKKKLSTASPEFANTKQGPDTHSFSYKAPPEQSCLANCPPTFAHRVLTFDLHYLIGVLHHLVLGLIAEGVSPGLDKVQDLTADTCLHLPLHRKGGREGKKKNLRKRP